VPPLYNLNHLPGADFTLLMSGVRSATYRHQSWPLPALRSELQFKANVGSLGKDSETYFFQCKDCDHFHTVDETRVNADWH